MRDLESVRETAELSKHLDDAMELRSLNQIPLIKPSIQHFDNRSRGISGSRDPTLQSVVRVQRRWCGLAGVEKEAPSENVIWLWKNKTKKKKMLHTWAVIQISKQRS